MSNLSSRDLSEPVPPSLLNLNVNPIIADIDARISQLAGSDMSTSVSKGEKGDASEGDESGGDAEDGVPALSDTMSQLSAISRYTAAMTVRRLVSGYTDKKAENTYPSATTNGQGCWLGQKGTNRKINGYIQMQPVILKRTRVSKGKKKAVRRLAIGAHVLSKWAFGSDEERIDLLAGKQASHICHHSICANPDHITVESKTSNESRKACARLVTVILSWNGIKIRALPNHQCLCNPRCILRTEERKGESVN